MDLRARAAQELDQLPMPSSVEELWRYSPINSLNLSDFDTVEDPPAPTLTNALAEQLTGPVATLIFIVDGHLVGSDAASLPAGVTVSTAGGGDAVEPLSSNDRGHLDAVHDTLAQQILVIDVAASVSLANPIVIIHELSDAPSITAPWVQVRLATGSSASVAEIVIGGGPSLTLSTTECKVGDGAYLRHVAVQLADDRAWHLSHQLATVGRDGTFESFSVGLGANYDRVHTEVTLTGTGASSRLRSLYLGTGNQVHDIRTNQDHAAAHTNSDLLCKGAVADAATSVFTGTIHVRNKAVRSDAVQNNHNLVLGEHASAESVPNLDIHENDVRCAHGSTVGPVDEEQRYYLESRGIAPRDAERLLVTGFFNDAIDAIPIAALERLVGTALRARLEAALQGQE